MATHGNIPTIQTSQLIVVAGELALDGSNPTPLDSGLRNISSIAVSFKRTSAPGVGTTLVTYDVPVAGNGLVNFYGWKPTSSADCTLIASTGTETFGYSIVGTL